MTEARRPVAAARLGASGVWGVVGVLGLFSFAVVRLGGRGLSTVSAGLSVGEWLLLLLLVAVFVYGEGVKALQGRWVPFVVDRARRVRLEQNWLYQLVAPLYSMSLVGAAPLAVARAWIGLTAIVAAVLLVRALPDPWRGMLDLSVACALAWGIGAIVLEVLPHLRGASRHGVSTPLL